MKKRTMIIRAMIPCILWASAFPVIKLLITEVGLTDSTSGKLTLAGIRFFTAGILMLLTAWIRDRKFPKIARKDILAVSGVGLLSTTGLYGLYYVGIAYVTGVKTSILMQGEIFYVLLLAAIFLGEKIRKRHYYGMIFGFLGIIILNITLFTDSDILFSFSLKGEGFIMLASIFAALGQIAVKKYATRLPALTLNGWQMTIGGGILLVTGLIQNNGFIHLSSGLSILLLMYSIVIAAVAFTLWFGLIQKADVNDVTLFKLTIPIMGSVFSALLIPDEKITLNVIIALMLVFMGMYFVTRTNKERI